MLRAVDQAPVTDAWLGQVLAAEGHALFGAFDTDDNPLGFLYGYELPRFKRVGTGALLYEIEVRASARRRGAGTALVHAYLKHCCERGVDSVWVPTDAGNPAALALYASTGGKPFEQDGVLMAWDLSTTE